MRVSIYPFDSEYNKYIELMKNALNNIQGVEIIKSSLLKPGKVDLFILNWFENLPVNNVNIYILFFKKCIEIVYLKLRNKKFIYVFHNKLPHESNNILLNKILMNILIKFSENIVVHSKSSLEEIKNILFKYTSSNHIYNKCVYIPHPNYIGVYNNKFIECNNDRSILKLLFVGQIRMYKNVDLLVRVFNELNLPNTTLDICGKVSDKFYEDYIMNIIGDNENIKTNFKFIEDEEINKLIYSSDILVLPYDIKSSLNSGTIILAFSNKKTVVSPLIGTLKDFENKDIFFGYYYNDYEDHKKALKEQLKKVHKIYFENDKEVVSMGEKCFSLVKENNDIGIVEEKLKLILLKDK